MQRSRTSSHSAHEGAHRAHGFRTNATSRAWHFHSGVNNRSSARGDDMRAQKIRFPLHSCIFQANPSTVPAHTITSQNIFAAGCFCPSPAARFYWKCTSLGFLKLGRSRSPRDRHRFQRVSSEPFAVLLHFWLSSLCLLHLFVFLMLLGLLALLFILLSHLFFENLKL